MRVLLVEDDEDDYLVARRLLMTIYGDALALTWVSRYEDALTQLRASQYDACLVDYRLGSRNGLELLYEIKADTYPAPIILLTGQGDREIDEEAVKAGAADYLVKSETGAALMERSIRYGIHQKQAIMDRRQLADERKARIEAEAANQAKDAVLAIISHELRSPLNSILGWVNILQGRKVDEETASHALETIERSAQLQSRLIEDLLDLARINSGKLRLTINPVALASVIEAALEVIRPSSESKNIEVRKEIDDRIPLILGDADRLQQVLWNLLSNAVKFTPEGGQIRISLQRADPGVRILVQDTGYGIRPDFLPYIFDPFSQQAGHEKPTGRRSGLGLGLPLARHLVELHGGTIEVQSEGEGKGTTFLLTLPLPTRRQEGQD